MFDVGFAELLLLSLIALMVLGPERLPRIARTLGGLSRKARSSWLSLKRSIDEEIRKQDLKEPVDRFRDDFRSTVRDFKSSVDEVKTSVDKARSATGDAVTGPAKSSGPEAEADKSKAQDTTPDKSKAQGTTPDKPESDGAKADGE